MIEVAGKIVSKARELILKVAVRVDKFTKYLSIKSRVYIMGRLREDTGEICLESGEKDLRGVGTGRKWNRFYMWVGEEL
ncbi:MAG TPA: hypothetical protein DEA54_05190 [Thermodesulfobacterium commune]|nr:hypothetical protein [Thermodesulfobacterium commune]